MNNHTQRFLVLLLALVLPVSCFAAQTNDYFHTYARIISVLNVALEITSVICIKQYFFLGDRNQTNFQIFNLIFGVVFYFIALSFLVSHKIYYEGIETKSASQCISWFFFGNGIYSYLQWMVIAAMVLNVIYIKKYRDA